MTKSRRKGGAQFQGGWREKTGFSTVLQSFAVVVKGSVTEEWFSGVLRSFFRVGAVRGRWERKRSVSEGCFSSVLRSF